MYHMKKAERHIIYKISIVTFSEKICFNEEKGRKKCVVGTEDNNFYDEYDDDEDDNDEDYLDWEDNNMGMNNKLGGNSSNNPNQQNKINGPFQPAEKVMRKYIDKINVGM